MVRSCGCSIKKQITYKCFSNKGKVMIFDEFCYVELVMDKITNRNKIIKMKDAGAVLAQSSRRDCYRSYYRHPVAFREYVRKNKTVSGWDGEVYTDYLWLDIDSSDLEKALENARHLIGRLEFVYDIPRTTLKLYFSGSKGFHVGINSRLFNLKPSRAVPTQCKALATEFAGDIDIDLAIYDRVRIFRLSNTINTKSGLYKISLTAKEIETLTIEEIKELAKEPRTIQSDDEETNEGSLAYMLEEVKEATPAKAESHAPQIKRKHLHGTKICLWQLLHGVGEGARDSAALRLAADFAKKGMPAEITTSLLRAWNQHNSPPMNDNEIVAKIASAYGRTHYDFGCKDHLLMSYCHEDCFLFKTKDVEDESIPVYTIPQLEAPYLEYVKGAASNKVHFPCIENINLAIRGLRPGEVCVIMARPGVGKSLMAQTILSDVAGKQKIPSIMFSIEMPKEQVYERAASIETGWSTAAVEEMYMADDYEKVSVKMSIIENIYVVDKPNLSLSEIGEVVDGLDNIGFIGIDYLSLVRAPGNSIYERTSYVARQLKTLAKEMNAPVLMLSQVSRKAGDGTEPITLEHGRDSGAIEEGADFLIGMWRDDSAEGLLHAQLLKGRRGGSGAHDYITLAGESVRFAPATQGDDNGGRM